MPASPFHIYAKARELAGYVNEDNKLLAAYASSDIKIYPYQIAAALFALRSPYLKGVILADEGSLGKTYEALLIATQRWYEGKIRQLLVLPTNMVRQWTEKIEGSFTLSYSLIDTKETFDSYTNTDNPFEQDGLVITTYDFAVEKADYLVKIKWDQAIFDEASCLAKSYTEENKTASTLKRATEGAFRLLLTPTPITLSIMDVYGLLHFIDESILPDEKWFYNRYFRRPENYPELSGWVSQYCFRTLKIQVTEYVNFTNRIPYTLGYDLTTTEKKLYKKLDEYLALPQKLAYPKMERYDLTLMYHHTVSSSAQALCRTLDGAIGRIEDGQEKRMLQETRELAESVQVNGKMTMLLTVLKKCFSRLSRLSAEKKAIVFTDNLSTLKVLRDLLKERGYGGVLTYSGQNSRDYSIMERFRKDKNIQILVATDEAAKGLDIEFCPVVINYDLLYNAVEMEQRITRCHRQGQSADVLVVNLLGKDNFADVRVMELINKRVLQFSGIFGLSDHLLGNFDAEIDRVLDTARHRKVIEQGFVQNLTDNKQHNKELVAEGEDVLFTSFTKEIAEKVAVSPQYIEDHIEAINNDLWEVMRWYFEDFNRNRSDCRYVIDEQARTITAQSDELPDLFYYWSGSRNRPYHSLKQYGMSPGFKPHGGRITLAGILGRSVLDEVCCENEGTLTVDAEIEPCTIGFYDIDISPKNNNNQDVTTYFAFMGQTASGRVLSDTECREIMSLPVLEFSEEQPAGQHRRNYNSRIFTNEIGQRPSIIDTLVPVETYIERRLQERDSAQAEEIGRMKHRAAIAKTALERDADALTARIKSAEKELEVATDRIGKIESDKRLKVLRNELRKRQDNLFLDRMRIDLQLEKETEEFIAGQQLKATVSRHYLIEVRGK